jgi:hypothetical protein
MSETTNVTVLPEVTMTLELATAIQNAVSATDIKALIVAAAEQELATRTQLDADQATATQAAADKVAADQAAADAIAQANQKFARTEVIGGREFHFEASTEGELDRQVLNAFKVAYNVQQPAERAADAIDPAVAAAAAAAAEADVLAKTELERKFRLGEITTKDYIEQSGAMNEFLANQGISVESLKNVVTKNQEDTVHQSWVEASEVFRNTVGADWPGGEKNRALLGDKLAAMGLVDAEDKVDAMGKAWAAMKTTGAYFEHGDEPAHVAAAAVVDPVAEAARIAAANIAATAATADAVRVAAALRTRATSSSMFGASSGVSGAPILSPAVAAAKSVIPADASPQEILAAFHAEQIKNGIDPNAAFIAANRAKAI